MVWRIPDSIQFTDKLEIADNGFCRSQGKRKGTDYGTGLRGDLMQALES